MSNPGPFQLIANDGKIDNILQRTKELNRKLGEICLISGEKPSLNEISQTHVIFPYKTFKPFVAIAHQYERKPAGKYPNKKLGCTIEFNIDQVGDFIGDMVVHIRFSAIGDVNADLVTGTRYRYCDYPGMRLAKKVRFNVNNNPIDEYNDYDTIMYNNFEVQEDKRAGWDRCMGHDRGVVGTLYQSQPQINECKLVKNGAQTFKTYQEPLDLWIPLLFWFCEDPSQFLPSINIPNGQRRVIIDLAAYTDIIQAGVLSTDINGNITINPVDAPTLNIEIADLYVNNLHVNPEIKDIFISKIGFNLIRVNRSNSITLNQTKGLVKFPEFKLPIETIYFGFRPFENVTGESNFDNWFKLCKLTMDKYCSLILIPLDPGPGTEPTASPTIYYEETPVVDKIGFEVSGIKLYELIYESFYRNYIPYKYKDCCEVITPKNGCAYMVSWSMRPGKYQPTGYINISRAKEFRLNYESSTISPTNQVELLVSGKGINFMFISDGTASLRFIS